MTTTATKKLTVWEFRNIEFSDDDPFRYELIYGNIVKKTAPTLQHQRISRKLLVALDNFITQNKLGEIFDAPVNVVFDENNVVEPDLVFVSEAKKSILDENEGVILGVPDLIIEIISPSSVKNDRGTKMDLYEYFGVLEYWIVDPNNASIELYVLENKVWKLKEVAGKEDILKSKILEGLKLEVSKIF
jgi:Uma2 family endonuclease